MVAMSSLSRQSHSTPQGRQTSTHGFNTNSSPIRHSGTRALGWRYSYTDAEGVTTLVYANRNLLEAMTNPDSQSVTNSYDALRHAPVRPIRRGRNRK